MILSLRALTCSSNVNNKSAHSRPLQTPTYDRHEQVMWVGLTVREGLRDLVGDCVDGGENSGRNSKYVMEVQLVHGDKAA